MFSAYNELNCANKVTIIVPTEAYTTYPCLQIPYTDSDNSSLRYLEYSGKNKDNTIHITAAPTPLRTYPLQ
jgi:hypothetical protein